MPTSHLQRGVPRLLVGLVKVTCAHVSPTVPVVNSKVASDTNGHVTATDPVNTAVPDLPPEID